MQNPGGTGPSLILKADKTVEILMQGSRTNTAQADVTVDEYGATKNNH